MSNRFNMKKGIAVLLSVLSTCGAANATLDLETGDDLGRIRYEARGNHGAAPSADFADNSSDTRRSLRGGRGTRRSRGIGSNDLSESVSGLGAAKSSEFEIGSAGGSNGVRRSWRERLGRRRSRGIGSNDLGKSAPNLDLGGRMSLDPVKRLQTSDNLKSNSKSGNAKKLAPISNLSVSSPAASGTGLEQRKGTWNPFEVLGAGFNGMHDGWKRLRLSTGQKILSIAVLAEMFSYIATNKGIGEHLTNVFVDLLATNIAKIFKKDGVFKTTREYYNVDMALQDEVISKMIPGLHYLARVFASVKGNWIDFFVAFITGCLGKPASFASRKKIGEFMANVSDHDMLFADAKKSVDVLKTYIFTVGLNFRRTRLNMMMYRLGAKMRALAKHQQYNYDNEEPV